MLPVARFSLRADAPFTIRKVPPPTAQERQKRRDAMERVIKFGAAPYRDAEGKARCVFFKEANKEANNAPVEACKHDRGAKRGYRRTQYARKAAGQMAWHPEDQIELAKRLGVIYHREGRSVEGAAERGLYDAIWRYEHVFDRCAGSDRQPTDRRLHRRTRRSVGAGISAGCFRIRSRSGTGGVLPRSSGDDAGNAR